MAIRAFWQAYNRHDQLDRIELHDSEYGGAEPELEFRGDDTGFTRQWDEITSESNEKLINIQANRIQIGKYDFRPRIENATGFQILEDIRDSDNKRFHIVHKIDGTFEWAGWVTTRIFSYPEKDNNFFAHIRATDFEILKGIDYPLDDTRQTFLATFADILGELPEDTPIKTATSWVEQNVTARVGNETYDFLDEIRHETKALREFGRTGDETDQPITKFEAIERISCPGLLVKQVGGHVMIDQLTELADPQNVNETVYDHTGSVTTTTQDVDRRQTGYTTTDNGTPTVKNTSENDTYPAIKTARNLFDHRTKVSGISFPDLVELEDSQTTGNTYQQLFIGDGSQTFLLSFDVYCETNLDQDSMEGRVKVTIDNYYLQDDETFDTTQNLWFEINLTRGKPLQGGGNVWRGSVNIEATIPDPADGAMTIEFAGVAGNDDFADYTRYSAISFEIRNPVASENSTSILYELTQSSRDFANTFQSEDTWFGDGPIGYSTAALRHGTDDGDLTSDTWRRRGQTIDYRNFHENLLKEFLDLQRNNNRKLEAEIWGTYDPTKVLDYNGSYFYFAGGKYDGTRGKWRVTLMELDLQTDASDTFDDIPKFTDETGSGSGSTSSGGGGGGLDQSTADARYLQESSNLSDLDSTSTAITNLGITATASELNRLDGNLATVRSNLGLTDGSADLDLNSLAINGDDLFTLFYTESEIDSFFDLYYSKADLTDGDEDLHLNSLELTTQAPNENYALRADRSISTGDGLTGGGDLTSDRTLSVDFNNPLRINSEKLDIFNHSSGQRGVITPNSQDIYGDKIFQADIKGDDFSDWFSANPNSWEIQQDGTGDFRALFIDELVAKAFTVDVAQALAGSDFLTKSVAKLAEDFTVPAVGNTVTITVEDLEGLSDLQTFESGDWVRFRVVDRTGGGLTILDVYGTVSGYTDNVDDTQSWTYTVDYAGASDAAVGMDVYKGALALDYGESGDTFIERSVLDRSSGTDYTKVPYDRVVRWTNSGSGGPRPSASGYSAEVLTQRGNINGLGPFTSETFGVYAKDNFYVELDDGGMNLGKDVGPNNQDGIHLSNSDYWYSNKTFGFGGDVLNGDGRVNVARMSGDVLSSYGDFTGLLFDGNNDYVDIDSRPAINGGGSFTIEIELYPTEDHSDGGENDEGPLVFKGGYSNGYVLTYFRDRIRFRVNGNEIDFQAPSDWLDNWHNITGRYDGSTIELLYDGDVKASSNIGSVDWSTSDPIWIFRTDRWSTVYMGGEVREVRFWDIVRSNSDIQDNMFGDVTGQSNLEGYWQFESGSGTTADDTTANGYDGTVNGASWITADSLRLAGATVDEGAMWSVNNNKTYQGDGIFVDWLNERMSLGSVFSADGGADTGRLASSYFDSTDLWGGDSNKSNANLRFDFSNSKITISTGGSITNTDESYTLDNNGLGFQRLSGGYGQATTISWVDGTKSAGINATDLFSDSALQLAGETEVVIADDSDQRVFTVRHNGTDAPFVQGDAVIRSTVAFDIPTYTNTERSNLSPEEGWLIYNTDQSTLEIFIGGSWTNV